ncbi:tail length tape measure protein [Providencia phage Kokobel1]|uniref:Tape measure protein N-terminal domain-containing protein n=1 Tax=Providencia phage Kokobel1 TaxID=2783540 RepID=A0A873WLV9_9CAUD|nr:tail length tape measure protein [Providencia phage Kokobel1]QPB11449.1 hypothetical protein [Providencia phage Kokobel1]
MANRDVELRIRAKDDSQKTLKQVSKSLDDLTAAQSKNAEAAKRGDISARELEQQYKKLENAGQQLLRLNSLAEMFTRQKESLSKVSLELTEAKKRHSDLSAAMGSASNVTKKMQTDLDRAERAVKRLTDRETQAAASVQKTSQELNRFGISSNNLAAAQNKIRSEVDRTNAALKAQEKVINGLPSSAERAHAKILAQLKLQANQLAANAKGYQTLGRVMSSLPSASSGLADLLAPAEAARRTIKGLEDQVKRLSESSRKSRKDLTGMRTDLKNLEAAAATAVGMSRMIETFQRQTAATKTARAEYRAAAADAKALAAQVRASGVANDEMGAKIQAANARLREAQAALRNETAAARQTQAALRAAGIDTRNLGAEQQRLRGTVEQTISGTNNLRAAMERLGSTTRKSGGAFSFFRDEGRTTLSFMQRMRGEVLGLVSAYVGFQGAIDLAGNSIDAFKVKQQAMVKMGTIVGPDESKQLKEWQYMLDLSEKLGVRIDILAKSYSKFAVASSTVGMTAEEYKYIYESVAKMSRVYHLSADDMNGVFLALEQMMSKGQVYAEELKQQLGERLPGAVALFAKGEKMTVDQFMKAMENGEIKARSMLNFATEINKAVEGQLSKAVQSVDAIEARAANAKMEFERSLAESGFLEAYTNMLIKLTDFIKSERGQEAAKKLGEAFAAIADGIIWAVDNVDMLINVLMVLGSLKVIQVLVGTVRSLMSAFTAVKGVITTLLPIGKKLLGGLGSIIASTGLLTGAVKLLTRAIPFVGWALLAWDIVSMMYDNNEAFRNFCDETIERAKHLGTALINMAALPGAAIRDVLITFMRPVTTMFADAIKKIGKWLAELVAMIPVIGDGLADWVNEMTDDLTKADRDMFETTKKITGNIATSWDKMTGDVVTNHGEAMDKVAAQAKGVAKVVGDAIQKVNAEAAKAGANMPTGNGYSPDPGTGTTPRDRDINSLKKEIEARIKAEEKADLAARKALQRKNLAGRLAIIDEEYKKMYDKAKAIGGAEGDAMIKDIDKVVAAAKKAEITQFNAQQRTTGGMDKRKRKIEEITQAIERMNAEITRRQTHADPTSSLDDRIAAEVAKSNVKMNALKAEAVKIGGAEGKQLESNIELLREANNEYLKEKMQIEEVKRLQDKVNAQLDIKKNKIEEVNAQRQAGLITDQQQAEAIKAINEGSMGGITAALDALSAQAMASSALFSEEELVRITTGIGKIRAELQGVEGEFTKLDTMVVDGVLGGLDTALNSAYDGIVNVATGAESIGDAFTNLGVAVGQFFADFLKKIAMAILQQMLLNSLAGMGGGTGAAATSMGGVAAPVKHAGGMAGSGGRSRGVSAGVFASAPRFHTGGLPGIRPNEIPTILERGEEVLSKNDPRNIMNGGAAARSGGSQAPMNFKFVAVDDRSSVAEAMATSEGEQVMLFNMNRKAAGMRSIINRGGGRK